MWWCVPRSIRTKNNSYLYSCASPNRTVSASMMCSKNAYRCTQCRVESNAHIFRFLGVRTRDERFYIDVMLMCIPTWCIRAQAKSVRIVLKYYLLSFECAPGKFFDIRTLWLFDGASKDVVVVWQVHATFNPVRRCLQWIYRHNSTCKTGLIGDIHRRVDGRTVVPRCNLIIFAIWFAGARRAVVDKK